MARDSKWSKCGSNSTVSNTKAIKSLEEKYKRKGIPVPEMTLPSAERALQFLRKNENACAAADWVYHIGGAHLGFEF